MKLQEIYVSQKLQLLQLHIYINQ